MNVRSLMAVAILSSSTLPAIDYYADPINGNISNAGTEDAPWSTLAAVISARKKLLPGDHLYLRRGYHGNPVISGINTSDVFIAAQAGHTPLIRSLTFGGAVHWNIKGLTISPRAVPTSNTDTNLSGQGVTVNSSSQYNTVEDCYLYVAQNTSGWDITTWKNSLHAGFAVYGQNNIFRGNHLYNTGNIFVDYGASGNYFGYNTVENFSSDGFHLRGSNAIIEYNLIMNGHDVSGNHNDLCQGYGSGTIFRFNELRAYSDPHQPFIDREIQGLGGYDGVLKDWVIEGNLVRVDHTIGIWFLGPQRFTIKNNTVIRCGTPIKYLPSITVKASKSGGAALNNTVTNNTAELFTLSTKTNSGRSIGTVSGNVLAHTYTPTSDITPPSKPTRIITNTIPGYGVDVSWNTSTDNIKVVGYQIYRNGAQVGRSRTGTHFFDLDSSCAGLYTIRAYDYNENLSEPSVIVDGSQDVQTPTIPENIKGYSRSVNSTTITWNSSIDNREICGYDIFRNGSKIVTTTATTFSDTGLDQGTTYTYAIRSFDAYDNFSGLSTTVHITTLIPDDIAPSIPSITVTALSSHSIVVSWLPVTDNIGVFDYSIYCNGQFAGTTSATTWNDHTLNDGSQYTYMVIAHDAIGNNSTPSAPVSATTQVLPVPLHILINASIQRTLHITWDPTPDANVIGYSVYRNGIKISDVSTTVFTDSGLKPSTNYVYTLVSRDTANNQSELSAAINARTMDVPPYFVRESFDYVAGPLVAQNGGTGWLGGWQIENHYDTEAGRYAINTTGLPAYPGLASAGRSAILLAGGDGSNYPSAQRMLATPLTDNGGTYWIAFQLQAPGYHKDVSLSLVGASPIFIQMQPDVTGMNFSFCGSAFYAPADLNTHLFVVKIDMSGDDKTENVTLYYDPALSTDPSRWTALRSGSMTIAAGGITGLSTKTVRAGSTAYALRLDELRIATSWQQSVGQAAPLATPSGVAAVAISQQICGSIVAYYNGK